MGTSSSAMNDPMVGYSQMMQAQAAQQSNRLGADWLDFSKQQFDVANQRQVGIDAQTKAITDQQLASGKTLGDWASADRARYNSTFVPLQDEYIDKARNWDSAGAQANVAAQAKADVAQNYALMKDQNQRAQAARGIRPDSGAWAGTARTADTAAALGEAGAQNMARRQLINEGMALRGNAINMGANLPGQSIDGFNASLNAGTAALGNTLAAENNFRSNIGIMNSGFEGNMAGNNASGSMWQNIGQNRADMLTASDKMRMDSQNALFGGLGSAAGLGAGIYASGGLGKSILR
jgi:hypothetical protein